MEWVHTPFYKPHICSFSNFSVFRDSPWNLTLLALLNLSYWHASTNRSKSHLKMATLGTSLEGRALWHYLSVVIPSHYHLSSQLCNMFAVWCTKQTITDISQHRSHKIIQILTVLRAKLSFNNNFYYFQCAEQSWSTMPWICFAQINVLFIQIF